MRILSIESSAVTASVAILEDDTLVAEYTINHKMTHSQTLLPMIDEIFSMVSVKFLQALLHILCNTRLTP